jgi:hypothetical protein
LLRTRVADDVTDVPMRWHMFGSSGLREREPADSVLRSFVWRESRVFVERQPSDNTCTVGWHANLWRGKRFLRTASCLYFKVHFCTARPSGVEPRTVQGADIGVRMNHYSVKSVAEYLGKAERGRPIGKKRSMADFYERECNHVPDTLAVEMWLEKKVKYR